MATVSSHVLDSVTGRSAVGVKVECVRLQPGGVRQAVFSTETDAEGRVSMPVEVGSDAGIEFELVFLTGDYFAELARSNNDRQIMRVVVVRIAMPDPQARYHVPIMAAPHSYSVWWSA